MKYLVFDESLSGSESLVSKAENLETAKKLAHFYIEDKFKEGECPEKISILTNKGVVLNFKVEVATRLIHE